MKSIKNCLNKQLTDICQHSQRLEELSKQIKSLLPADLANSCQVSSFNKGCLTLSTTDANWASQLRYAVPELRDQLRKEAGMYQLSSIKIALTEPLMDYSSTVKKPRHKLSEKAKASIISESEHCSYLPLKKALLDLGS